MIFFRKRTILFIGKEKIRWAKGRIPDGKIFGKIQELPWTEENLRSAILKMRQKFPRRLRIVVGEDFSYVARFQKSADGQKTIDEARSLIPENLEDSWDTREGDSGNVQLMAVQKEFFSALKKMIFEANLRVEAIEAESISASRMIPAEKGKTVLFGRNDNHILLGAVREGLVLSAKTFSKVPEPEKIQEFIEYVSGLKGALSDSICLEDKDGTLLEVFNSLKFKVKKIALDPMVGICRKKDIAGRDKEVLNIFLKRGSSVSKTKKSEGLLTFREKIILIVFLVIFSSGTLFAYYARKSKRTAQRQKPSINLDQDENGLSWERGN